MKDVFKFIKTLNERGIYLFLKGDKLKARIENGAVSEDLRKEIKANEEVIISYLQNTYYPLSFAQERLWFMDQYDHNATYNLPAAIRLFGRLNKEVLEKTLVAIVSRHEVLRTNFVTINDDPKQVVHDSPTCNLEIVNLSHLSKVEAEKQLLDCIHEESQKPFDLANESLIRFILYTVKEEEAVLFLNQHHIVSDGWSFSILINEMTLLYDAFSNSKPSPLKELPIQYGDYAIWQKEYLEGEVLQKQADYWKGKLEGVAILELPTDKVRPKEQTFNGDRLPIHLNKDLSDKLNQLSLENDVTLFMTLLSAFKILLQKYTGQADISVGSPIANRTNEEVEGLIGFFVNTLALRSDVNPELPFNDFLGMVKTTTYEAYANQDIPFEKVVDIVEPERNLSYSPLFQVMMMLQNNPVGELKFSGLSLGSVEFEFAVSKFDITLNFSETPNGLYGSIEYNTDLFESNTIERMAKHFEVLVEQIIENPRKQIKDLEILTSAEKHQLLVDWNDTRADYPKEKCIHQLFEEQVERTPNKVAVVFEEAELTYRQLNEKSNQLAHYLLKKGVKPESLVGICVSRSLEMIVGLLGVLKAGGAYVPIDPTYPQDRISYILEDADCEIVLTQEHLELPKTNSEIIYLESDWNKIENESNENVKSKVTRDNVAYVIYTSGSTGKPKGTIISHSSVQNLIQWHNREFKVSKESKSTQLANMAFDASVWEIWPYLSCGASLFLVKKEDVLDTSRLFKFLDVNIISHCFLPTPIADSILNQNWQENTSLKYLLIGGDKFKGNNLNIDQYNFKLINNYGPTENTVVATSYEIVDSKLISSIGKPISNVQTYIVDNNVNMLPIGVVGELCISGDSLARGYLNQSELTAEKFIRNPFSDDPNSRLYKTGDLARYLPDGNIEFIGRKDDQVKIRGFRIELGEIESALNQQEEVSANVVLVKEFNSGSKQLVAYVVPSKDIGDKNLNVEKLRGELSKTLPEYMVPSLFVSLETIPVTPNGKIDKKALPEPEVKVENDHIAPSNELEDSVVKVWAEVLGIDENVISTNKSFFEIGGNSMLSVKLQQKLSQLDEFKDIQVADLFKYYTINKLVQSIQPDNIKDYKLQSNTQTENHEIAIIGMSGAFSGVRDISEFWDLLKNQDEGVRLYSKEECEQLGVSLSSIEDPDYIPVAGQVKDIDQFDPVFWDVSPNDAKLLDPQIRKFIEHCWFVLESSGYINLRKESNIGVFAGSGNEYYYYNNILNGEMASQINTFEASISNNKSAIATKTSYMLDLSGPANSINTACSTGLISVIEACNHLRLGTCNMALAGGVTLSLPNHIGYTYQEGMILSKDGHCRTFDEDASGTIDGSGVAVVLLKRLEDAIKDNDNIISVIKGYASNNDGRRKTTYTAPSVTGQIECIINAQEMAGVSPGEIDYVECHGTATNLGDPIEIQALKEAFEFNNPNGIKPKHKTVLGAVKANIGHTDAAAGTAGLIKVCLMLQNNMIPGQPNYNSPNPNLNIDQTNFEVVKENRAWLPNLDQQRIAGVSAFGIGGTNAHVIVRDYVSDAIGKQENNTNGLSSKKEEFETVNYVVPISAKSKESLKLYKQELIKFLGGGDEQMRIEDIAFTLQEKREHFNYRSAYSAKDIDELIQELNENSSTGHVNKEQANKIVFMFPGQGAQYPCMAKELYDNEEQFKTSIDKLILLANVHLDVDLFDVIFPESGNTQYDINETRWAQITLFVIEYAFAEYVEHLGIQADAYIGHSLGEYVAATLSGVFTLEDAVKIVIARGKLMQTMPLGSMLAIKAEEEVIHAIVETHNCEIAVINSIENIVVSGSDTDVNALKVALDKQSISSVVLNTSHAYHSRMMEGVAIEFESVLGTIKLNKPTKYFASNVSGEIANEEVSTESYWSNQLRNTVQFAKGLHILAEKFNNKISFIEVGPGKGLSSFVTKYKNDNSKKTIQAVHLLASKKENSQASKKLKNKEGIIAKLWASGIVEKPNDLKLFKQAKTLTVLPTYQFNYKTCWLEMGKPQVIKKYNPIEDIYYERSWERVNAPSNIGGIESLKDKNIIILVNERDEKKSSGLDLINSLNSYCDNVSYVIHQQSNNLISDLRFDLDNASHIDEIFNKKIQNAPIDIVIYISPTIDIDNPCLDIFAIRNTFDWALKTQNTIPKFISISYNNYEVIGNEVLEEKPSIVSGVTKSIPFEYFSMDTTAYHVDLSSTDLNYNDALISAILHNNDKELIAVRGEFKWFPTYQHANYLSSETLVNNSLEVNNGLEVNNSLEPSHPVFLITGGLGGVGFAYANYLTQKDKKCTVILLGRTKKSDLKEAYKTRLDNLLKTKHNIIYEAIDIGSAAAVDSIEKILAINNITAIEAILHSAGVGAKSALNDKTHNDIVQVVHPKILGVENLLKLARSINVDYFVSCSSMASMLPSLGQMEYTTANLYLDELSHRFHSNIKYMLAINLNQISDTGMAVDFFNESNSKMGKTDNSIKSHEFPIILEKLIQSKTAKNVIISRFEYNGILSDNIKLFKDLNSKDLNSSNVRITEENYTETELKVAQIWNQVLGVEEIGLHDNFFELGGHSLHATQVISKIKTEFNNQLPLNVFYELPTVHKVSEYISVIMKNRNVDLFIDENKDRLYEI